MELNPSKSESSCFVYCCVMAGQQNSMLGTPLLLPFVPNSLILCLKDNPRWFRRTLRYVSNRDEIRHVSPESRLNIEQGACVCVCHNNTQCRDRWKKRKTDVLNVKRLMKHFKGHFHQVNFRWWIRQTWNELLAPVEFLETTMGESDQREKVQELEGKKCWSWAWEGCCNKMSKFAEHQRVFIQSYKRARRRYGG